jgi:hypothetical protein
MTLDRWIRKKWYICIGVIFLSVSFSTLFIEYFLWPFHRWASVVGWVLAIGIIYSIYKNENPDVQQ